MSPQSAARPSPRGARGSSGQFREQKPRSWNPVTSIHRLLLRVFGSRNERVLKSLWPLVGQVAALEPAMQKLSDAELRAKTPEFRDRLASAATLDDLLPEAFAAVREAARRNLRTASGVAMRHFDVQILGGIILHRGKIAEMVTGEGKTLVATLAAYLNALAGRGVHVITVNDYLARRDRDWMNILYESLGVTAGAVQSQMESQERQAQYACDITYGTNSEFGFDYLRDNMKPDRRLQVQRSRSFAIVDEVDSILIDEARTPLIISGPAEESTDKYYIANRVAKRLARGQDFEVKEKERSILLTETGIDKAEKLVGVTSFYVGKDMEWPHLIEQAVRAHNLFAKDVEYVVREGEVVIVDEFTGRLMEGRTWSEGLHQAIEAKEGLSIRRENQTLATITLQNYFKLYEKLSGMTGTAMTEAGEFDKIYKLDVVAVPPNRPVRRVDSGDVVYRTAREKYTAIVDEIVNVNAEGRPILVGTVSIEKSELLSGMLKRRGIAHDVLNAKHHQREAEIVSLAGQPGRVTISTNMAGRGTDIVLGPGIAEKGGLHVVGTERHEARRIDNQLRGRCARQGDPGSSKFFLCLEDDLMRRFASDRVGSILKRLGMKEGEEISHPWVTKSIERAQKKVEAYHFELRRNLLEYDAVMSEQRTLVYSQRQEVLEGGDLSAMIHEMMAKTVKERVGFYFNLDVPAPGDVAAEGSDPPVHPVDELENWLKTAYGLVIPDLGIDRSRPLPDQADAACEKILETYQKRYEEKRAGHGDEVMKRVERFILLMKMDEKWKDHLYVMDQLRHAIGLRQMAQVDPKMAYKQEGYQMFSQMIESLRSEVTQLVFRVQVRREDEERLQNESSLEKVEYRHGEGPAGVPQPSGAGAPPPEGPPKPIVNKQPKVGRNDACPCGSGKKFKHCCARKS
ncbi:MAG TPA: preprotein translocase subunit SecA [Planctomycetota bacterium]|nr:preprotein translocase subunit SecA [Planctomycetota bacterium]